MSYYKKLCGDRIYLSPRDASPEEVDKFTIWMNDTAITDYTGRTGQICTYSGEKSFLGNSAMDASSRQFNIISIKDNQLIGTLGLVSFNWIDRSAVLGIFIGDPDYRSGGYGTEAINLLLDYAFRYLNLHSVRLDLIACNERAHKCYQKCGFKDVGRSRDAIFLNGRYYDKLHMDILESEFQGEYIRNKEVK